MATVPQWIKLKGSLIPVNCQTSISRMSQSGSDKITIFYQDGTREDLPFTDPAAQMASLESAVQARSLDDPNLASSSNPTIANASLPKDIFLTGGNLDSSAAIVFRSYSASTFVDTPATTVVWINSTTLKVTVPALAADTYDIIYSDVNLKTSNLQFGLVVT